MSDRTYHTVILGAFLHDIGKFFGRGRFEVLDKGQHPKFSADFVSAFSSVFEQVVDSELLRTLVMKHHEDRRSFPHDLLVQSIDDPLIRTLAALVSKADNLSALERGKRSGQYQDYKTTPMFSVLERVNRTNDEGLRLRFHLAPLVADATIFPSEFQSYAQGEVNTVLTKFGRDFRDLFASARDEGRWRSFDQLATHITNVVYKYTWSLPSNTQEPVPDVSLYDHLRTTAAIAACLYQYHTATNSLSEDAVMSANKPRFLLCAGDISGIQDYIFDIASIGVGGVARRLRARSFYVQLCSEVAALRILKASNLPLWNLLMNSGGRFYILLANTPEVRQRLETIWREFDGWFLTQLNGELRLNLAYYAFADDGFAAGDAASGFGHVLGKLSIELQRAKQRQLAKVLQANGRWKEDSFVLPTSFDGRGDCASCHKFPEQADGLCWHCSRDLVVGSRLPGSRYVAIFDTEASDALPVLGWYVKLSDSPRISGTPVLVMKLNPTDLADLWEYPAAWKHVARHVPRSEGETLTFEDIAAKSRGKPLLAYLKADVDRLGETFVFGLKRPQESLDTVSRQATMSRLLDLFFAGWMEHLVSTGFSDCYVVFSGGDDVLLVGPWDRILQLSLRLRTGFADFAGCPVEDRRLTLSAGIALVKPDYPVARAVVAVDDALKLSKNAGRNRITVLGTTLTWQEWDAAYQEWSRLCPLVEKGDGVSSAFLHNLVTFGSMWREYGEKGNVAALRFHPLLSYHIRRNVDARKNPELAAWATRLLKWPPDDEEKKRLDNLGLIASLLLYSRKGGD